MPAPSLSIKEKEADALRKDLSFQHDAWEEQHRTIVATKNEEIGGLDCRVADLSKELESANWKLNEGHQSWSDQVLMLQAKDKQIALLNAKLERLQRGAQPTSMNAIKKDEY